MSAVSPSQDDFPRFQTTDRILQSVNGFIHLYSIFFVRLPLVKPFFCVRLLCPTFHLSTRRCPRSIMTSLLPGLGFHNFNPNSRVKHHFQRRAPVQLRTPWLASLCLLVFEVSSEVSKFSCCTSSLIPLVPPSLQPGDLPTKVASFFVVCLFLIFACRIPHPIARRTPIAPAPLFLR